MNNYGNQFCRYFNKVCQLTLYLYIGANRIVQVQSFHFITSQVAIYFSETGNICPVRVWNREIWQTQINMEIGTVNIKELVNCFHFSSYVA